MIFCYKFRTFAEFWNFCLAKYRGQLIHGYSKTCIFLAKKQESTYTQIRLIHRFDLYTDSTYTPENTVTNNTKVLHCDFLPKFCTGYSAITRCLLSGTDIHSMKLEKSSACYCNLSFSGEEKIIEILKREPLA